MQWNVRRITKLGGRWLAAAGASAVLLAAMNGGTSAAPARDVAFAGLTPVSAGELQELRGGFRIGDAIVNFQQMIEVFDHDDGGLRFRTFLRFPEDGGTGDVNGVEVENDFGNPTVEPGTSFGHVILKSGNHETEPEIHATFPHGSLTIFNSSNDAHTTANNSISVDIHNASSLTGGFSIPVIRAVSSIGSQLLP